VLLAGGLDSVDGADGNTRVFARSALRFHVQELRIVMRILPRHHFYEASVLQDDKCQCFVLPSLGSVLRNFSGCDDVASRVAPLIGVTDLFDVCRTYCADAARRASAKPPDSNAGSDAWA
jgi:hypothetical protein